MNGNGVLFDDFTRESYLNIIKLAKNNYIFRNYLNFNRRENFVIWRHDVDFSVHSALRLARIESAEGVSSTYFILLHSEFYNVFEKKISILIKEILALGHNLGLHFDHTFYEIDNIEKMEEKILFEKEILENIFEKPVDVFSFHNPDSWSLSCQEWKYAGLVNTYAEYFMKELPYCSDSNGYWRFERLQDILASAKYSQLQVLTHPAWWTDLPMSPFLRIKRCLDGRVVNTLMQYEQLLLEHGRVNIR